MSERLDHLIGYFETITEATVQKLRDLYAADASFKDPFNEVHKVEQIEQIFAHMFGPLSEPRFIVRARIEQGDEAFLTWDFRFRIKKIQTRGRASHSRRLTPLLRRAKQSLQSPRLLGRRRRAIRKVASDWRAHAIHETPNGLALYARPSCQILKCLAIMEGFGTLAQLVEQRTFNPLVGGSSPPRPTTAFWALKIQK